MNKQDLLSLSRVRLSEARTLLGAGHYSGAYYLAGYAVECAIKACVAKQFRHHTVPDKELVAKFYQHSFENLLRIAGIWDELSREMKTNKKLSLNWTVVKDWSVDTRYRTTIAEHVAKDFVAAVSARKHGVLAWVKKCI